MPLEPFDLYALAQIERDCGWFLEHGYIESGKSKTLRKLVNQLCHQVLEQAVPLVDAFGTSDELLAPPIALEP